MSAAREIIAALIAGGMDPVEAAALMARAAVEMSPVPSGKSAGALRQQRYRERNKASQSVTPLQPAEASQGVTNRNESVTRDVSSLSIEKKEEIEKEQREGPARQKASRRTRLPDDWQLSERNIAYAAERGFDRRHIDSMAERFVNHHRGKGTVMADWNAAWQTWVGNEIKFNGAKNGRRTVHDAARDLHEEALRRLAAFDEPAPRGLLDGEGSDVVRLLPPGRRQ